MSSPIAIGTNNASGQFEGVYVHYSPETGDIAEFVGTLKTLDGVKAWVAKSAPQGGFSSIEEMESDDPYGDSSDGLITTDEDASQYTDGFWVVTEAPFTMEDVDTEDDEDDDAYAEMCEENGIGFLVSGTDLAITYVARNSFRNRYKHGA